MLTLSFLGLVDNDSSIIIGTIMKQYTFLKYTFFSSRGKLAFCKDLFKVYLCVFNRVKKVAKLNIHSDHLTYFVAR